MLPAGANRGEGGYPANPAKVDLRWQAGQSRTLVSKLGLVLLGSRSAAKFVMYDI
jgi:hypothetical protein